MAKKKCQNCKKNRAVVISTTDLDGEILSQKALCLKCYKKETRKENIQLRDKKNLEFSYEERKEINNYK